MKDQVKWIAGLLALATGLLYTPRAVASVALLMEEPYGQFGAFNPTGHAAIYLNHVCAETPTHLRACHSGELGVVISRYHKIDGYDWVAIPLIPYLYAVETPAEVPASVSKDDILHLRDGYRRTHLQRLAPDRPDGRAPDGEWIQLVGQSFYRAIRGFQVDTTPDQDERFIALVNDRKNISHFNLVFHNCADFSRAVLDTYFPDAIHRNLIADLGVTTPKQVAKTFVRYGREHPEMQMSAFYIPQVPGEAARSHAVHGVTESLVKSKRYLLPMALFAPQVTGGVILAYLLEGRGSLPSNPEIFEVGEEPGGQARTFVAPGSLPGYAARAPATP